MLSIFNQKTAANSAVAQAYLLDRKAGGDNSTASAAHAAAQSGYRAMREAMLTAVSVGKFAGRALAPQAG
jgi:hypothetical protein